MSTTMRRRQTATSRKDTHHGPARLVVRVFLFGIVLGTVLLLLPWSAQEDTRSVDALFTAVSAVCLTGLVTVDTGTHWTPLGQAIILGLIQIGGLGVMALASLLGLAVVGRLRLSSRLTSMAEGRAATMGDVRSVVRNTTIISLTIEGLVAIALAVRALFLPGMSVGHAVWFGVFHSVSAFNNAGFALQEDSLMPFRDDLLVLLPISVAIILGGLGFPVIVEIVRHTRGSITGNFRRAWTLTTKIVLSGTALLLALGFVMTYAMEYHGSLADRPLGGRIVDTIFASITVRTAGFNTVDYGQFHDATLLVTDVLMLIGGGSGGTAGGLKITTVAVILAAVVAEVRGARHTHLFGRRLGDRVQRQAITVAALAMMTLSLGVISMLFLAHFETNRLIFETVSAFATVGLSTGLTSDLPPSALIVLCILMFLGRVGPVTLVSALDYRATPGSTTYPEERPLIG